MFGYIKVLPRVTCQTEGCGLEMGKETIIFFDRLGFGWVFDNMRLKEMDMCTFADESLTNKSLIKIIENILSENSGL